MAQLESDRRGLITPDGSVPFARKGFFHPLSGKRAELGGRAWWEGALLGFVYYLFIIIGGRDLALLSDPVFLAGMWVILHPLGLVFCEGSRRRVIGGQWEQPL